jgi:hypothetical protein
MPHPNKLLPSLRSAQATPAQIQESSAHFRPDATFQEIAGAESKLRTLKWHSTMLLSAVALYLFLCLFIFPRTPLLLGGDQTYFWMDAQRMLAGEQPYRDFFQFTPPGTDFFYLAIFRYLSSQVWVTNAVVIILGIALCWICLSVAREIMQPNFAALAAAFFVVFLYGRTLNATHHWFSCLAVMCAVKLRLRHSTRLWTAAAGALLGLASFFTQTRGIAAVMAFAIFIVWERYHNQGNWRRLFQDQLALLGGFFASLLVLSAHIVDLVGWRLVWYYQITFVRRYVVHGLMNLYVGLPEPLTWHSLPRLSPYLFVYVAVPMICLGSAWRSWRGIRDPKFPAGVALIAIVGTFLVVEVGCSLNWLRLFAVSMPGIILLVWITSRLAIGRRWAFTLLWTFVALLATRQVLFTQRQQTFTIKTPGGTLATSTQKREKLQWMVENRHPEDLFFEASGPSVYLPLQSPNPLYIEGLGLASQTLPEHIDLAIQQLEAKKVHFVLWPKALDTETDVAEPRLIAPLRDYLGRQYFPVHVFLDGEQVWQRK